MSNGLENLDVILESSRSIAQAMEGLDEASLSDQLSALHESVEPLEELGDKFFMNTVAAIPVTKVCVTGTEEALGALESFRADRSEGSLSALKQALSDLSEAVEELLDRANMRGTTLT